MSCKKDNYIETNNQLYCFGSKEPHNDDIKSVILSESERSHNREDFTNNAILRGLNNYPPQKDGKNSCRLTRGDVGKLKCKVAFTLAETLITLGIIGVVAALTIPTLVEKYQERLLVTSYKRVYSLLNQAYQSLIPEYGPYSDWEKTDIDNYNKFKTRLKISVDCPPNKSNNPCLTYKDIDYVDLGNNEIEGSLVSYFSDEQPAIRLVTGESIIFWSRGHGITFVVDLNGDSKPNKLGADLHFFSFNSGKNGLAILPGPIWSNPAKPQGCNSSYYWFPGSNCGYWILKYDNMKYLHMSDEEIAKNW